VGNVQEEPGSTTWTARTHPQEKAQLAAGGVAVAGQLAKAAGVAQPPAKRRRLTADAASEGACAAGAGGEGENERGPEAVLALRRLAFDV
jgi:hypothetical protein